MMRGIGMIKMRRGLRIDDEDFHFPEFRMITTKRVFYVLRRKWWHVVILTALVISVTKFVIIFNRQPGKLNIIKYAYYVHISFYF